MLLAPLIYFFFFFNDTATTEIYTLSLHDALPISATPNAAGSATPKPRFDTITAGPVGGTCSPPETRTRTAAANSGRNRSEEHTSELQSPCNLVCRLLLEKKKNKK